MAQPNKIRDRGAIPERRHDAFLLALLLAFSLNIAFFAVQAILPRLAYLLQVLGPEARLTEVVEEEEALPFVLVDPSILDEEELPPEVRPETTSTVTMTAKQNAEPPDIPVDSPYIPEGVDEILTFLPGNIGPDAGAVATPGVESEDVSPDQETVESDSQEPTEPAPPWEDFTPEDIPEELPEPVELVEPVEPIEPIEPIEPVEIQEVVEPVPEWLPPPPEEFPEPVDDPPPPEPEPISEPEPAPEPTPEPPLPDMIDLAALPVQPDGMFVPDIPSWQEPVERPIPTPAPQEYREPVPEQRIPQPQPQQQQPARPERPRRTGRKPEVRQVGGARSAGGAPRRRNVTTRADDFFSDPYMAALRHKYAEYMNEMADRLQKSLNATMSLYPTYYSTGVARLRFRLDPSGQIIFYETISTQSSDGSDATLELISKQTLTGAGPFGPPPPEMVADPLFQRMSLQVTLY